MSQTPQDPNAPQAFPSAPDAGAYSAPVAPTPEATQYGAAPVAPEKHALSVKLLWASVAVALIAGLISLFTVGSIVDAQLKTMDSNVKMDRDQLVAATTIGAIIGLVISVGLSALFVFFWQKGHGWARIVLTILAVFAVFSMFSAFAQMSTAPISSIGSILNALLLIAGVVVAWNKDITAWLNARKVAQQHTM